jgi:uncharacterized RDD family membrane protein YckC
MKNKLNINEFTKDKSGYKVVDFFISLAISFFALVLVLFVYLGAFYQKDQELSFFGFFAIIIFTLVFVFALYNATLVKYFGQTIGHKLFNIKIVNFNDKNVGFWKIFFMSAFEFIPFIRYIDFVQLNKSEGNSTFTNKLFKTKILANIPLEKSKD